MPTPRSISIPGLNGPFLQSRLPDWLKHATPDDVERLRNHQVAEQFTSTGTADWFSSALPGERQALLDYQARRRASAQALATSLKPLKGIGEFAEPLFRARLTHELDITPDVDTVEFVQFHPESHLLGFIVKNVPRRQSLMQAALQNFAEDAKFEKGSALAPKDALLMELLPATEQAYPRFGYRYQSKLDIEPSRFARLCHELDLGGRYQQHLQQVFEAPETRVQIRTQAIATRKDQLRVQMQIAFMKGAISAQARQMLSSLLQGERAAHFNGKPVRCWRMEMFGAPLSEVVVMGADRERSEQVEPIVVYMPGAPLCPLKEYPSAFAALQDLHINLGSPAYQVLLRQYAGKARESHVLDQLDSVLYHQVQQANGVYVRQFNPHGNLQVREEPIDAELFGYLQDRHLERLKADARVLAVPSADVDEQAREARLAYWEGIGFNVLNAAAFFVPGLSEVMAVVGAAQLVNEVVEGAQAWEDGDLDQVWAHLQSVGLNIALVAGLGMAGGAAARLESSEFVDCLVQVKRPDGQVRLWKPDLTPYASDIALVGHESNEQGLFQIADKHYIRLDNRAHEVTHDAHGEWRMVHPHDPLAYQPLLRHNGQGGWVAHGEQPLTWRRTQLMRRLGPLAEGVDDTQLMIAADISGISDDVLRTVHVAQAPMPPLLIDTLQRLQLNRQLDTWIGNVRNGLPGGVGRDCAALLAIEMPGWPRRPIEVIDGAEFSPVSTHYGQERWPGVEPLKVPMSELVANRLPEIVLRDFDEQAINQLLGVHVQRADRLQTLRTLMAQQAEHGRRILFKRIFAASGNSASAEASLLQRSFATLPTQVCEELVSHATPLEFEKMQGADARLPLRLAEEARLYQRQIRLNRAFEGIYWPQLSSLDSDCLAVRMLEGLPGWSGKIHLRVYDGSVNGTLIAEVGEPSGTPKTLVCRPAGYSAYDAQGNELTTDDTLASALLKALPDSERQALGLQLSDHERLRTALVRLAAGDRLRASAVLGQQPVQPWLRTPLRLADGRVGYPLSGRGAASVRFSSALKRQVRSLYPVMSDDELGPFLEALGASDAERIAALTQRHEQYRHLVEVLDRWVDRRQLVDAGDGWARTVRSADLYRVAERIKKAWRRETIRVHSADGRCIGYRLDLGDIRLGSLPGLSADFSHVADLNLANMGLGSVPDDFLRAFSSLRWLSLNGNRLHRLGEVVGELQQLTRLSLQNNNLVINEASQSVLNRLTNLKFLQLENNPLGRPPALTHLPQILNLTLRNTGIHDWPAGVFELQRLLVLDLRDNQIARIPADVLEPSAQAARFDWVNAVTNLSGNPLDAQSLARLGSYRQRTGTTFGIRTGQRAGYVRVDASPAHASSRWLVGVDAGQRAQITQYWGTLAAEPDSGDFFRLLDDLRNTADFQRGYAVLRERVWKVLAAANNSTRLRQELFEFVAHPHTCGDGTILVFSQLEVMALVQEARESGTVVGAEHALMELARGLSRLDAVERIALREIAVRREAGRSVDEVEVRLAYRIGLAERLELPGQPRRMIYVGKAEVSQVLLDAAGTEVLEGETADALKASIVSRDFWVEFLKSRYRARFDEANRPYFSRLVALDKDKERMSDQVYLENIETIQQRRAAEEQRLVEDLTATIWNTLPGQVTHL
ncbi:putative E3 ubiquitin-protein ligase ipaH7.8 [compost metagenome]